ncbi:MAG: SMC-Scp complex subunit ScpB [Pseudomonadota bacterium]
MVEALLFAAPEPLTEPDLARRMPEGADIRAALGALEARYADRGIRLARAGRSWAFRTAPEMAGLMADRRVDDRPMSRAGVETLAIMAYQQPVTRTEIEEIRGVGVSKGTLDLLLELGWVRLGKRRETPGRPATFVTTDGFLDHFGLASARDLPGLKDLRAAGLLDTTAAAAPADLFEEDAPDPEAPAE